MASSSQTTPAEETATQLVSATKGFDYLFSNDIAPAKELFSKEDTPFHLLGLGVCAFLEAALSLETEKVAEASRCLAASEAGAKKQMKASKGSPSASRFPAGIEWEILHSDIVVLQGMAHALGETYMGYLSCIYALNSAHSRFTKLFKTVFPDGLERYKTPSSTPTPSRKSSISSLRSATTAAPKKSGFFSRLTGSSLAVPERIPSSFTPEGPVEEMIVAGAAFGYGLFNLVFSLLPQKIQGVVGFLGYTHDRQLALEALAVSATKKDVHSVFSGLVLMTYHGVVLLLSGYQADAAHITKQYRSILDNVEPRYPTGALWVLNRAKLLRMTHKSNEAIEVLQKGLDPAMSHSFPQADTMLVFELSWILLQQRRYIEAADAFLKMIQLNSWSHPTYYFIIAGCYLCHGDIVKAQEYLDMIPELLGANVKKIGGKMLPTEVLIKKKIEFYQQKHARKGGDPKTYATSIQLSPADEIGIFWNTHAFMDKSLAESLISQWSCLTPAVTAQTAAATAGPEDQLDTPDDLALRALLLGIAHRTSGDFTASLAHLTEADKLQPSIQVSTWIGGVANFELAVTHCRQTDALDRASPVGTDRWQATFDKALKHLDTAMQLSPNSIDLSSRLDSRIAMLRDEIATKKRMLKI
ncbi:outer membrane protein Iml2/Tetratricopeptide repeat protein 39 [Pterulicium gracile]|uniref:Outer membrane protein Iml2/Tetratricopeptide repeat protein 39 n=1 Tax=Pterulicium gracile TaxID=1884261 RepID=A0A5C3R1G9_9AGAR|nr:outer membrane protein Iml2/Tetratricopeptide repeat protein 39 [Pterula gracilis]